MKNPQTKGNLHHDTLKNKTYTQGTLLSIFVLCSYIGGRFQIFFSFFFTQVLFHSLFLFTYFTASVAKQECIGSFSVK